MWVYYSGVTFVLNFMKVTVQRIEREGTPTGTVLDKPTRLS
jgi:hypothetical protein